MREIDKLSDFQRWTTAGGELEAHAIRDLDLRSHSKAIEQAEFPGSLFLACKLSANAAAHIVHSGGTIIPKNKKFQFQIHRNSLYSVEDLYEGYDDPSGLQEYERTRDYRIWSEYLQQGVYCHSIDVTLARRLHDNSISHELFELLKNEKTVAVMGGHCMERRSEFYKHVAVLSRRLTREGFLMASGGGPGAMEATHLGAYFAGRDEAELLAAIDEFKVRPADGKPDREYEDPDWLPRAWRIRLKYPLQREHEPRCKSIGIPTWLYGHEPTTPFATHIAKYFANSVREDGLLTIAHYGVIFAPGSAGTTQEIFQDAAQNHYGTAGAAAPMILFGVDHWTRTTPVWPLLSHVAKGQAYEDLISITDDIEEIIKRITDYDPDDHR